MVIESKIKQAAFQIAVDITLKGMNRNPERCARNLVELFENSFPDKKNSEFSNNAYNIILNYTKMSDGKAIRDYMEKLTKN